MANEAAAKKEKKEKAGKARQPSALKRDKQAEKGRLRNKAFKSGVRTAIRQFDEVIPKGDAHLIKEKLNEVYSLMDKGVKKGIYKLNKASRTKSRLAARAVAKA